MKAKIDNNILEVKVINSNYNDHAKEVEILEGIFKGVYAIVENHDFIIEQPTNKNFRYYVQRSEQCENKRKTATIKKCETLEESKQIKARHDKSNHSNIYSYYILDRMENERI